MAVYHKTPQDSNRDISRPNEIPPIAPPMPDNITGNIGNNFKVQELGKNFFQGEEMANQFAQKQMDKPVPPPGDPIGDQLGSMFMQPFNNGNKKVQAEKVPQKPKLPKQNIERVVSVGYEVEKVTAVAGVRGAEAEDEALALLYYRRSMKGLSLLDLKKAYGKLQNTKDNLIKKDPNHPKLEKINNLLSQLKIKMKKV